MLSTASPVASSTQTQKQNAQLFEQLLLNQKQNAQLFEQFLLNQKQNAQLQKQFLQVVQYLHASSGETQSVSAGRQAPAGTGPNAQSEQLVRPLPSSPPQQAQDGRENKPPEFPSD